jgi:exodeoxyribonuclease-3
MKIYSYNVNGIRSAVTKGLVDWLKVEQPDIICFQELKASLESIPSELFQALGYHCYYYPAQKKGYSGVGVLTKVIPNEVAYGSAYEQSDFEGRVIKLAFDEFVLVNAYFPSGSSGEERQVYKYQWLDEFYEYTERLVQDGKPLVICGDYNICHKEIDIHNPKGNKDSSGFLPDERAWMDKWFCLPLTDAFRHICADPHHYSWWSFRANARANNKGWRIDYISISNELVPKLKHSAILPDVKHSDHCPVMIDLNIQE